MSDMEIAIGFRRKSSDDLLVLSGFEVILDDIADEMSGADRFEGCHSKRLLQGWKKTES